jgi:hypothetical protein
VRRPNHHHHATGQKSYCLDSPLWIVKAQILYGVVLASEHVSGFGEIEAAILKGLGALRRIESDAQLRTPKMLRGQELGGAGPVSAKCKAAEGAAPGRALQLRDALTT